MAVGRLAAGVVEVVEKREALHQRVRVGSDSRRRRRPSERVAIAARNIAQDLIVGAVFTNDHEYVLDQRRIADLLRDSDRLGMRAAASGSLDIPRQVPVVVQVDLIRPVGQCPDMSAMG